jgi:hypothetical protein
MLLKDFNSELRNRMHAFLWRQWGQLGLASATVESKDEWVIDPEALLLLTGTLGRWDPRLFDEVIDWILKNAYFINFPRLKSLLRAYRFDSERVIAAVATVIQARNSRLNWRFSKLDIPSSPEPFFWRDKQPQPLGYGKEDPVFRQFGFSRGVLELRGLSRRFNPVMPECALLRLRALLGISARAEIIIYLCTHGPAHPSWIARETGFSQKNVQDTLVGMAASHVVHVGKLEGRKKSYFITNHDKATLLHDPVHPPRWVTWSPLFRAVEIMWLKLLDLEAQMPSPLLFSSQLRQLKDVIQPLAEQGGYGDAFSNDSTSVGESYIDVFLFDADRWLQRMLNEKDPKS